MEIIGLTCSCCGATLELNNYNKIIRCPYCDTINILSDSIRYDNSLEDQSVAERTDFTLNRSLIHKKIIEILDMPDDLPLDVYDNTEVKALNKLLIPAYMYTSIVCSGLVQYDQGVDREYVEYENGEHSIKSVVKHRTEWIPMSISISDDFSFLASGNKQYEEIILALYGVNTSLNFSKKMQSEIYDEKYENFDLSDSDIVQRLIKPIVVDKLNQKAHSILKKENTRNIRMIDSTIMNCKVKKVYLSVYEIVIRYFNNSFSFYISNDGSRYAVDELPCDPIRSERINNLKQRISELRSKKSYSLFIAGFLFSFCGLITFSHIYSFPLLGIGLFSVFLGWKSNRDSIREVNKLQLDLEKIFEDKMLAKNSFITKKVALKGVLSDLSGDATAF